MKKLKHHNFSVPEYNAEAIKDALRHFKVID